MISCDVMAFARPCQFQTGCLGSVMQQGLHLTRNHF